MKRLTRAHPDVALSIRNPKSALCASKTRLSRQREMTYTSRYSHRPGTQREKTRADHGLAKRQLRPTKRLEQESRQIENRGTNEEDVITQKAKPASKALVMVELASMV